VASGELQGWHADPFGLHEMRYFSVGRPTKLVRDGRIEAYDEPPKEEAASSSATVSATADGVEAAAAVDVAAAVDAVEDAADLAGATRVLAPGTGPSAPRVGSAAARSVMATAHSDTAVLSADTVRNLSRSDGVLVSPKKRRWPEYAAVAVGAAVAVLVFVALEGGSASPGVAPAAFVTKAAHRTLSQSTADVTLTGTAQLAGEHLAFGGTGQLDLASNTMSLTFGASSSGGSITETELLVGGNMYLDLTANGHSLAAVTGGRHWVEVPFAQTASRTVTTGSPGSSLSVLSEEGASVTPLGPRSINGETCNGYIVTPSRQAMLAGAEQEWARMGLSDAQTTAARQALQGMTPPTITAWFDATRQLACQLTIETQVGAPTLAGSGSAQMVLTFTHYGVPVKVTAPAPSDTISLQQLLSGT
jgi:hypothetical protein